MELGPEYTISEGYGGNHVVVDRDGTVWAAKGGEPLKEVCPRLAAARQASAMVARWRKFLSQR